MEYNFRNIVRRWQILKSTKVYPGIFALALIVSEILTYTIFAVRPVTDAFNEMSIRVTCGR